MENVKRFAPKIINDIVLFMKVFLSVKYHQDMSNRLKIEQLLGLLERLGYTTFCVVRDVENWGSNPFG